jgi:hypothetical protein
MRVKLASLNPNNSELDFVNLLPSGTTSKKGMETQCGKMQNTFIE